MNVIFIKNDTFRRDHVGCYGNPGIHTPNLDRFAEHAAVFDHFYAASYPTVPNRFDLVSGRFGFPYRGWQPLSGEDVTWGDILGRHGLHTQMIWDTPMLAMHSYNYTRGFKGLGFVRGQKGDPWETDPSLPIDPMAEPYKIRDMESHTSYLRNHHGRRYERQYCVGRSVSAAMDWLETNHRQESFFLWLDMWDPHEPFDCPWYDHRRYADPGYTGDRIIYPEYGRVSYLTEEEQRDVRALYAGNVTLTDRWLGQLFDLIERLGLFENTLIVWASDHGHLFGEHGLQGKPGAELGTLYEETTHIPLLVHHPEGRGAGQRVQGFVQPPDILPSILEALELPIPSQVQGRPFWDLVDGGKDPRPYAFSSRFPPTAAEAGYVANEAATFDGWVGSDRLVEPATVTGRDWTYICAPEGRPSELYDMREDPRQRANVVDQHPEVARAMRDAWIDFLERHGAPESRVRPFREAGETLHTPHGAVLHGFRDDRGTWLAFPSEREALARAQRRDPTSPARRIERVAFGDLIADDPRHLVHLFGQYYWAEDLA